MHYDRGTGQEVVMPQTREKPRRLPPRWFVRLFWHVHRAVVRLTRGRLGLWRPKPGGWGAMRLTVVGRRTGRSRRVMTLVPFT